MAENYKLLYEQMKKLVAKYQDEIVPGLREQIESRVEVCRCKDCKHWDKDFNWCDKKRIHMEADDFCSYGERREGE